MKIKKLPITSSRQCERIVTLPKFQGHQCKRRAQYSGYQKQLLGSLEPSAWIYVCFQHGKMEKARGKKIAKKMEKMKVNFENIEKMASEKLDIKKLLKGQ